MGREDPILEEARSIARELQDARKVAIKDAHLAALLKLSRGRPDCQEVLSGVLLKRWDKACKRMESRSAVTRFAGLLEARRKLDELRGTALRLVRDERLYPYPYEPPEADPDAVQAFQRAQANLDEAIAEMRLIWRTTPGVKLPGAYKDGLPRALWVRAATVRASKELGLIVRLPKPSLPPWTFGLPMAEEVHKDLVTMETFGLSLVEAQGLSEDRAIEAANAAALESRLEGATTKLARERLQAEFEQVARTNEYRRLLGLRALAWSPKLFAASRQHAEYLSETGEIGHSQPREEYATHTLRAARAGYPGDVYENCHGGSTQPEDALSAWLHSSAHHRTILRWDVTEIATARSGLVWVQNYGLDTGFRSAIQWSPWRD